MARSVRLLEKAVRCVDRAIRWPQTSAALGGAIWYDPVRAEVKRNHQDAVPGEVPDHLPRAPLSWVLEKRNKAKKMGLEVVPQ